MIGSQTSVKALEVVRCSKNVHLPGSSRSGKRAVTAAEQTVTSDVQQVE